MPFPYTRLRRLRRSPNLRDLVAETEVSSSDLIAPLFIVPGKGIKKEIPSMPGQYQLSADLAKEQCNKLYKLGIKGVILFGLPEYKDENGSSAWKKDGVIPNGIREIKEQVEKEKQTDPFVLLKNLHFPNNQL